MRAGPSACRRRVLARRAMLAERRRRSQDPALLDCLQFSNPGQIIARDVSLRAKAGFVSRRRADEVVKRLEALRNNLAHSPDIVDSDWDTILALAENLERVLDPASSRPDQRFRPEDDPGAVLAERKNERA
jgi:hypothetical protein